MRLSSGDGAHAAKAARAAVLLGVSLSYLSYVFGVFRPAFWRFGLGDWIDPYFINYLLEHWYYSVTHFTDPASPFMFYPARKTLGYSHGLILYAPFYIPFRLFFHPFHAYSLSLFAIIETGIVCLYVVFRRFFHLSFVESLLLTAFFFTSSNAINGTVGVWSQRASVFLIPPILLVLLASARRPSSRGRLAAASLSGFLAALLFVHDFYTAIFTGFFAALALAAAVFVEGRVSRFWREERVPARVALMAASVTGLWAGWVRIFGGGEVRILGLRIASHDWRRLALVCLVTLAGWIGIRGVDRIKIGVRAITPWLWAVVAGLGLGAALFLWIYLPAYLEHPSFPEQDLLHALAVRDPSRWTGILDAVRDLGAYSTLRSFNAIFILGILAWTPWFDVDRKTRLYAVWAIAISLVVLIIPLQVGGVSVWLLFFRRLPGFSAVRDPTRIVYLYELAATLAVALLMTRFRLRSPYRLGICTLLLIFIATERHTETLVYDRPVEVFRRWVKAPIAIDPACQSFYIKGASSAYMSRSTNLWALYSIDAMFISLEYSIPTLNGYSAWSPDGWNLLSPQESEYAARAREWIEMNGLRNVCELDIEARTMRPVGRGAVGRGPVGRGL